jgi:hypothetical protein
VLCCVVVWRGHDGEEAGAKWREGKGETGWQRGGEPQGGSGHGGHGRERRGQHAASTAHAGNRYPYP